jgi:hypothetical protein
VRHTKSGEKLISEVKLKKWRKTHTSSEAQKSGEKLTPQVRHKISGEKLIPQVRHKKVKNNSYLK